MNFEHMHQAYSLMFADTNTIYLRCLAFFQPTSRTVDFSLWFKNSDHMITFFVALWFQKYW